MQSAGEKQNFENAASSQTIGWHKEAVSFFAVEASQASPGSPKKRRVDLSSSSAGTPPLILMRRTQQQEALAMQLEPTHFGSDRAAGVDRARNLAGVSYPADCGTTTRIKNIEFYEASYDNNREKPLAIVIIAGEDDGSFKQRGEGSFSAHGPIYASETTRAEEKNPHPKSTALCKEGKEKSTGSTFVTETTTSASCARSSGAQVLNATKKVEYANYPKRTPLSSLLTAVAPLQQAGGDRYASSIVPEYGCSRRGGGLCEGREASPGNLFASEEPTTGTSSSLVGVPREQLGSPTIGLVEKVVAEIEAIKNSSPARYSALTTEFNARCGFLLENFALVVQSSALKVHSQIDGTMIEF